MRRCESMEKSSALRCSAASLKALLSRRTAPRIAHSARYDSGTRASIVCKVATKKPHSLKRIKNQKAYHACAWQEVHQPAVSVLPFVPRTIHHCVVPAGHPSAALVAQCDVPLTWLP